MPDDTAEQTDGAVDSGDCVVEGTDVGLSIFEDEDQLKVIYGRAGRSLACAFAEPVGIELLPSVVGPVWTIAVESSPESAQGAERLARRIATIIGASVRTVRCNAK